MTNIVSGSETFGDDISQVYPQVDILPLSVGSNGISILSVDNRFVESVSHLNGHLLYFKAPDISFVRLSVSFRGDDSNTTASTIALYTSQDKPAHSTNGRTVGKSSVSTESGDKYFKLDSYVSPEEFSYYWLAIPEDGQVFDSVNIRTYVSLYGGHSRVFILRGYMVPPYSYSFTESLNPVVSVDISDITRAQDVLRPTPIEYSTVAYVPSPGSSAPPIVAGSRSSLAYKLLHPCKKIEWSLSLGALSSSRRVNVHRHTSIPSQVSQVTDATYRVASFEANSENDSYVELNVPSDTMYWFTISGALTSDEKLPYVTMSNTLVVIDEILASPETLRVSEVYDVEIVHTAPSSDEIDSALVVPRSPTQSYLFRDSAGADDFDAKWDAAKVLPSPVYLHICRSRTRATWEFLLSVDERSLSAPQKLVVTNLNTLFKNFMLSISFSSATVSTRYLSKVRAHWTGNQFSDYVPMPIRDCSFSVASMLEIGNRGVLPADTGYIDSLFVHLVSLEHVGDLVSWGYRGFYGFRTPQLEQDAVTDSLGDLFGFQDQRPFQRDYDVFTVQLGAQAPNPNSITEIEGFLRSMYPIDLPLSESSDGVVQPTYPSSRVTRLSSPKAVVYTERSYFRAELLSQLDSMSYTESPAGSLPAGYDSSISLGVGPRFFSETGPYPRVRAGDLIRLGKRFRGEKEASPHTFVPCGSKAFYRVESVTTQGDPTRGKSGGVTGPGVLGPERSERELGPSIEVSARISQRSLRRGG